tara:strand:- start:101 stop:241 length:141 start_codon:yes stop_codon:yes gene_type:complete
VELAEKVLHPPSTALVPVRLIEPALETVSVSLSAKEIALVVDEVTE